MGNGSSSAKICKNDAELGDLSRHVERYWDIDQSNDDEEVNVFTIRIVKTDDKRASGNYFLAAKEKELSGILKREIWQKVSEADIPKNANILGGLFILSLKNCNTPGEKAKVRYVEQGFNDRDKPYMVHDVSTLRMSSIRIVLSTSAVVGLRLLWHDVTQAYLQSKSNLKREVYIRPKQRDRKILGIEDGVLFRLKRPLYGL